MTYDLPPTSSGHGQQSGNGGVRDQARNLGSEAAQSGGDVAQTAKEQGREVVGEAGRQARNLYGEARSQLTTQASDQQRRAAGGLRSLADEMRSMADQGGQSGPVSEFARQAADRVHGVAGWLENREPGDLITELRDYARRNPGTFLLGAAALGVVAGRLTRNIAAASGDGPGASTGSTGGDRSTFTQPVADADSTVVLPPTQPTGDAETTQPTRYADTTQPIGNAETTQPIGNAETTQPIGHAGPGEPAVYGDPRPPVDETDPLPSVPSRGARP